MTLIILARYWQYIVIAILTVALALSVSRCSDNANEIDAVKAEHQLTLITEQAAYLAKTNDIERANNERWQNAVNQSSVRQKQIADKYDSVVVINDSLSDSIINIETSLINANRTAVIDYTKSVNGLFAECSARYLEMAKNAAREQEEARRLREAWPTR